MRNFSYCLLLLIVTLAAEPVIKLPADFSVSPDEGFVTVKAECTGEVRWLVLAQQKIKYITLPNNTIVISITPTATKNQPISVFAIGLVGNQMTDFARTIITVNNNPSDVQPVEKSQINFMTILIDPNKVNNQVAKILNSKTIRAALNKKGINYRVYERSQRKDFDKVYPQSNPANALFLQSKDGTIITAISLPETEEEILSLIN